MNDRLYLYIYISIYIYINFYFIISLSSLHVYFFFCLIGDALILLSELTWRTHVKVVRNELIPLLVKFWDDASPYVV